MIDIYDNPNIILNSINIVHNYLMANKLVATKEIRFDIAFKRVQEFLNLNSSETSIFCCIFVMYFYIPERANTIGKLSDEIKNSVLRLLEFQDEIDSLEKKGFIYSVSTSSSSYFNSYKVPDDVIDAIIRMDNTLLQKALLSYKDKNLIYPEDISYKELFYSKELDAEISKLTKYLSRENFKSIQKRLQEKGMPKGLCIMFYGEPGTGKTESVYQIAKKTGREIYRIDIGTTTSIWHGGTIKNLTQAFKTYNIICEKAKKLDKEIPILFFNEADAIFGKRIEAPQHGAEIDENHTQNMLLDYIERQEGLIIATTNFTGNFDEAFERRFLFKVKFEKPNLETKKKIWKNKFSWIKKESIEKLASTYDFSGAQIENISRKTTMDEVLSGKHSSFKDIEKYCNTEKFENSKQTKIGFVR